MGAVIKEGSWPVHPVFRLIQKTGNVPDDDMKQTFNMGIGYIIIVDGQKRQKTIDILKKNGFESYLIGRVLRGAEGVSYA